MEARKTEARACALVLDGDYGGALDLVEGLDGRALGETSASESVCLRILADMWGRHGGNGGLEGVVGRHEERLGAAISLAAHAKRLNVPRNELRTAYDSLVDHAARVYLRQEVMLDNHEFWPWINTRYPSAARLLSATDVLDTNAFAQAASVHFAGRESPHAREAMRVMDRICRRVLEQLPELEPEYSRRLSSGYHGTMAEMRAIAALGGDREAVTGTWSPGSDMMANVCGEKLAVRVLAHNDPLDTAPLRWARPRGPRRWNGLTMEASGITGMPAVVVLDAGEAWPAGSSMAEWLPRRFWEDLPASTELVVLVGGSVRTATVRDGKIVQSSEIARALERAFRHVTP